MLGYAKEFKYGDAAVKVQSWTAWARNLIRGIGMGAAIYSPNLFGKILAPLVPQTGEGPSRDAMERGFLKVHATATMVANQSNNNNDNNETTSPRILKALFEFRKDTAYLYTAALLCETGLLLVEKDSEGKSLQGGCVTPAVALGSDLTQRILNEMKTSLEITEIKERQQQ